MVFGVMARFSSICIFFGLLSSFVFTEKNRRRSTQTTRHGLFSLGPSSPRNVLALTETTADKLNVNQQVVSPYLQLPVFQHSRIPLVDKDRFLPLHGSGREQLPSNIRQLLRPVIPTETAFSAPSRVQGVTVTCGLNWIKVNVHKAILAFANSQSSLTFGTCDFNSTNELFFSFLGNIDQCGTKTKMVKNRIVYYNTLRYAPLVKMGPIRCVVPLSIPVECHLNRYYYSYKVGYAPDAETQMLSMKHQTTFTLSPTNAQWENLSPSGGYSIGQPMYFVAEAPSLSTEERLYIQSCFVTVSPSHTSTPQFTVIDNFGCMNDSSPHHHSRYVGHKDKALRFSLAAFVFRGMTGQHLFMHCKMSVGRLIPTLTAKSCTYNQKAGRWEELYGFHNVCSCCYSKCRTSELSASPKTVSSMPWSMHYDAKFEDKLATPLWHEEKEVKTQVNLGGPQKTSVAVVKEKEVSEPRRLFEKVFGFLNSE